ASCSTFVDGRLANEKTDRSLAIGEIVVYSKGKNPRQFPSQLRFFDVVNTISRDRTRVSVEKQEGAFSVPLEPGQYKVVRIQINEGPFMAESHVAWSFNMKSNAVTYIGKWELEVDTPRTERMVRLKVSEDRSSWNAIIEAEPELKSKAVVHSLAESVEDTTRLYAVAPNPKIKYFYRR
ncbi:MAG: hypothetical protein ACPGYT_11130, partial [Nitrospirales bacterium]